MVAPSRFCHVVFRTRRYEEMVDWYLKAFEARVQVRNDRIAFLTYDEEHHRMAIAKVDAPDASEQVGRPLVGVAHVAYAWNDLEELLTNYKRLKSLNIVPVRPTRHGMTLSMYYDDPDGNNLEFQIDLMDAEHANIYMRTPAFDRNPSGELFDCDELVARWEAGQPVNDLIFRSDQPESRQTNWVRAGGVAAVT